MSLKASELIELIKVCSDANVDTLEMIGLKINFKGSSTPKASDDPLTEAQIQKIIQETESRAPELVSFEKTLQQESLMITDPYAYEQAKFSGEIDEE